MGDPTPMVMQEFNFVRERNLAMKLNEHFKNWNPQENLKQLKHRVHKIMRVVIFILTNLEVTEGFKQ